MRPETAVCVTLTLTWHSIVCAADRGVGGIVRAPDGSAIGKQWLFVIGIDKYQNWRAWPELECAVSDAKAVRDVLTQRYHIDRVEELYDGDAGLNAIVNKLRWLAENTAKNDSLLIYYAGHGHLDSIEGIGFWVPVDSTREPTTWLGSDRIKRYAANMQAKHVLLVSDSCFAGDFFRERAGLPSIGKAYYRRVYGLPSRQAMTSGGKEPVADAACKGMSPFAYWLVHALRRNRKPYLAPSALFEQLKEGVAANSRQTPRVGYLHGAQHGGGEFLFFLKRKGRRAPHRPIPDLTKWQREQAELKRLKAEAERRKLLDAAKEAFAIAKQYDEADYVDRKRKSDKWKQYLDDFAASGHQVEFARQRLSYWKAYRPPARPMPTPIAAGKSFTNEKDASEMIYVPAGTFKMGKGDEANFDFDRETPAHDVRVAAFYISKHEITNRQFKKFVDANPQWRQERIDSKHDDVEVNYLDRWQENSYPPTEANHPVERVSWFAARAYCEWASSRDLHGRLPTEAEWEKACRAGSSAKFCFGDDESKLGDYAWYGDSLMFTTHPVGQKKPNAWGIHDMHGNVWEWTSSILWKYPYNASDGRENPNDTESDRAFRGLSWFFEADSCRSAHREGESPTECPKRGGFRLVLSARASK